MLFVDFDLESGQEDKKTDLRAEQPPHYDLLNIPLDPVTEKKKISEIHFKKKERK